MPHRKPTRDGSLVLKVVSHNYNYLSPRGDLGEVLIGPSPTTRSRALRRAFLSEGEATAVGTYASVQSVRLAFRDGRGGRRTKGARLRSGRSVGAATLRSSKSAPDAP